MKILNLLPKEAQKDLALEQVAGQIRRFWIWVIVTLGVLLLLAFGGSVYLNQRISINHNNIENKKLELSTESTRQLEQEVSSLNRQIALIDTLRKDHYYWSKVLIELTYLVDTDTKINSVQMDRETGKVEVYGEAADRESVLAFWSTVMKTELFKDIDFPLTNLERDVNANFKFTFYVNAEELKTE